MGIDFESEEIIVGRIQSHIKKYGKKGTGYIGKVVVSSGEEPVLGKKVLMDVSRSHVAIVCGKRGGGKCLTGNTLITLEDGREIPIKDLEKENKKIISLQNNLKLKCNKKYQFYKRTADKTLKITLRSGKKIELTPEHPLLTINGWKESKELKKGSRIATPRIIPKFGNKKLPDCEVKLLAYLIAEGHLGNSFVLFCNTDKKIISEFTAAVNKFDNKLTINKHGNFNLRIVDNNNIRKIIKNQRNDRQQFSKGIVFDKKSSIRKYLEKINLYNVKSETKFVPETIFQLPKEQLSIFLNRLFSCDGTIYFDKNKNEYNISYSSSSPKLIQQIQSLLLRFGLLSIIRTKKTKKLPNYELKILSSQNIEFIKKIGFFGNKKEIQKKVKLKSSNPNVDTIPKEIWNIYRPKNWAIIGKEFGYKLPKALRSSINNSPSREKLFKIANFEKNEELKKIATSDIFWDEIQDIKKINKKQIVYDITVPETHNFVANNIIVHNSYTMSVLIEEFAKQPFEIKERLSVIVIDTVGIFWTMKYPNKDETELLEKWNLKPDGIEIRNLVPFGKKDFYEQKNLPHDGYFSIRTSQMDIEDWLGVFRLNWRDAESSLLSRTIEKIKNKVGSLFDIDDIMNETKKDAETSQEIINSLNNRFLVAKSWGLFSRSGTTMKEFAKPGTITIVDTSTYKEAIGMESIKELIVGILGKRLYEERMLYRKEEEMSLLTGGRKESEMPIIWMMIDEAHMFMPSDRQSMALDVLLQWIRVGRQPGLSLLLATQRPNKLHNEAISQCDFFLSMRMTSQEDIMAVSSIRPSYLNIPMDKYYGQMPKDQGFAILLDDNSEKVMLIKVRPRITWDGGKTANVFVD